MVTWLTNQQINFPHNICRQLQSVLDIPFWITLSWVVFFFPAVSPRFMTKHTFLNISYCRNYFLLIKNMYWELCVPFGPYTGKNMDVAIMLPASFGLTFWSLIISVSAAAILLFWSLKVPCTLKRWMAKLTVNASKFEWQAASINCMCAKA